MSIAFSEKTLIIPDSKLELLTISQCKSGTEKERNTVLVRLQLALQSSVPAWLSTEMGWVVEAVHLVMLLTRTTYSTSALKLRQGFSPGLRQRLLDRCHKPNKTRTGCGRLVLRLHNASWLVLRLPGVVGQRFRALSSLSMPKQTMSPKMLEMPSRKRVRPSGRSVVNQPPKRKRMDEEAEDDENVLTLLIRVLKKLEQRTGGMFAKPPTQRQPRLKPYMTEFLRCTEDGNSLLARCSGCAELSAGFVSAAIRIVSPGETEIFCRECIPECIEDGEHWLPAPSFSRERLVAFVRGAGGPNFRSQCRACHDPVTLLNFHAAHNIAGSRGGSRRASNLRTACSTCNSSTGNKTFDVYARELQPFLPPLLPLEKAEEITARLFGERVRD